MRDARGSRPSSVGAHAGSPDGDGIAIWSSIQHPNWLQRVIASLLELPLSKARTVEALFPSGEQELERMRAAYDELRTQLLAERAR